MVHGRVRRAVPRRRAAAHGPDRPGRDRDERQSLRARDRLRARLSLHGNHGRHARHVGVRRRRHGHRVLHPVRHRPRRGRRRGGRRARRPHRPGRRGGTRRGGTHQRARRRIERRSPGDPAPARRPGRRGLEGPRGIGSPDRRDREDQRGARRAPGLHQQTRNGRRSPPRTGQHPRHRAAVARRSRAGAEGRTAPSIVGGTVLPHRSRRQRGAARPAHHEHLRPVRTLRIRRGRLGLPAGGGGPARAGLARALLRQHPGRRPAHGRHGSARHRKEGGTDRRPHFPGRDTSGLHVGPAA